MAKTNWKWIMVVSVAMRDQKTFLRELGEQICSYRKEAGLTQTDFGNLVGLSQQVIADYEAGNRNIPIYTVAKMAEILGVKVSAFTQQAKPGKRKRGPAPRLLKQLEEVQALPKERQRFVMQALEMALNSSGKVK